MNIVFVEIQNFRKLKSCRVEIASQETILVGANNSGKTSAMDAMILFLKKNRRKDIAGTDFTLSNWSHINKIGKQWTDADEDSKPDLTLDQRSEEHTSELQSHSFISYAVFCLKKKKK